MQAASASCQWYGGVYLGIPPAFLFTLAAIEVPPSACLESAGPTAERAVNVLHRVTPLAVRIDGDSLEGCPHRCLTLVGLRLVHRYATSE